jgi:hypothetical protein
MMKHCDRLVYREHFTQHCDQSCLWLNAAAEADRGAAVRSASLLERSGNSNSRSSLWFVALYGGPRSFSEVSALKAIRESPFVRSGDQHRLSAAPSKFGPKRPMLTKGLVQCVSLVPSPDRLFAELQNFPCLRFGDSRKSDIIKISLDSRINWKRKRVMLASNAAAGSQA